MSGMKMMVRTVYGRRRVIIIVGGLSILSLMNFLYFHHNEFAGTHLQFAIPMTADSTIKSAAVASPPSTKQMAPSWSMNFIEVTEKEEPQQQQPRHQDGNLLPGRLSTRPLKISRRGKTGITTYRGNQQGSLRLPPDHAAAANRYHHRQQQQQQQQHPQKTSKEKIHHDDDDKDNFTKRNAHVNIGSSSWDDIELWKGIKGRCGADKCFWKSISDPQNVGYLIASGGPQGSYDEMNKAYDFAERIIAKKCHGKHLLLGPPVEVHVPAAFVTKLNAQYTTNEHAQFMDQYRPLHRNKITRTDRRKNVYYGTIMVIQKVQIINNNNASSTNTKKNTSSMINFGFDKMKWTHTVQELIPQFQREILPHMTLSIPEFHAKLVSETLPSIHCAFDAGSRRGHYYWYDLQGMIDTNGNYYHVDIDSHYFATTVFQNPKKDIMARKELVVQNFHDMIALVSTAATTSPKQHRYE